MNADLALGELVLEHRALGVLYATKRAPLEIVERFTTEKVPTGSRRTTYLAIAIAPPPPPVLLAPGDHAAEAAEVLNSALGR